MSEREKSGVMKGIKPFCLWGGAQRSKGDVKRGAGESQTKTQKYKHKLKVRHNWWWWKSMKLLQIVAALSPWMDRSQENLETWCGWKWKNRWFSMVVVRNSCKKVKNPVSLEERSNSFHQEAGLERRSWNGLWEFESHRKLVALDRGTQNSKLLP